jgi:hypothetical protein
LGLQFSFGFMDFTLSLRLCFAILVMVLLVSSVCAYMVIRKREGVVHTPGQGRVVAGICVF